MAAHQAPPSLGFSRQEHWSGLPFPSPMHESENESEVAQSCLTPSDPMDCGLLGSSIHGIFQARDSQVKVLIHIHVYPVASFVLKFLFPSPLEDLDVREMVVHITPLLFFSL